MNLKRILLSLVLGLVDFSVTTNNMKKLQRIVRILCFITMLTLFLWQADIAWNKFQSKPSSLQQSLEEEPSLLYPSITFCTVNLWDEYPGVLEFIGQNESVTFDELKQFALQHHWNRERSFEFVSHSSLPGNQSYPCNTVAGPVVGKACQFPCLYESVGNI